MGQPRTVAVWSVVGAFALAAPCVSEGKQHAAAPSGQEEGGELAKKLANPISDLVSVPFQFNWSQGVGPDDQTQFLLNVQPVMPFALSEDLNLITRVIVPFLSQPPLFAGGDASSASLPPTSPRWERRSGARVPPSSC